jgi:ribulose-5-phosphate 4-epimerase/fuculose-1-phosphate aldolase
MRFYNRVTVDDGFDGMGLGEEAERLSSVIGENPIVVMGNHGVSALSKNIALAFEELYYFERACQNYITALMTGLPLRIASDRVAKKTAEQWQSMEQGLADAHLREIREILDREEPEYKQ